jgi:hypothetical protein
MALTAKQPIRTLLRKCIDYAGLFPPAALDMETAVRNYTAYRYSPAAWALGRFIVPASQLAEFEAALASTPKNPANPWLISALLGDSVSADVKRIEGFNSWHSGNALIDTVELKVTSPGQVTETHKWIPGLLSVFAEAPITSDPTDLIRALSRVKWKAKVRTGGTTPEMFPTSKDLARFLFVCASEGVAFKATAGLHHPVRAEYPLTYETNSPRGTMYGYLNVLLAAAFARKGMKKSDLVHVLEEHNASSFVVEGGAIRWMDNILSDADLSQTRTTSALSFGSCSFKEPLDELSSLGMMA